MATAAAMAKSQNNQDRVPHEPPPLATQGHSAAEEGSLRPESVRSDSTLRNVRYFRSEKQVCSILCLAFPQKPAQPHLAASITMDQMLVGNVLWFGSLSSNRMGLGHFVCECGTKTTKKKKKTEKISNKFSFANIVHESFTLMEKPPRLL